MANTKRETARGFASAQNASVALTNTATATTMYSQAISGGNMGTSKEMRFQFICTLTTGAVAPSLTITIQFGSSTLTVASAIALSLSQTGKPFIVEGSIINKDSASAQLVWAKITQYDTSLPMLLSTSSAMRADNTWAEDTTVSKTFSIIAQFGTAIVGTTLTFLHASIDLT